MKRDFTIGAMWSAAGSWIEQGASAIVFFLIARLIGVSGFGVASMTFAFLFLGEFLVRDTITEAILARPELERGRLEATFFTLTGFSIAVMLALMAISPLIAHIYQEPAVAPLLIIASPSVLMIGISGVSTAILRRALAYRTLATRSVLGVVCGGIVGVVMAARGFGPWSLAGQRLTEAGINSVFAFTAAGWRPRHWPTRSEFGLIRGLGPRVVVLRSLALFTAQTPVVALGIVSDPKAAGLYACAWRLIQIAVFLIVKPMQGVAQSAIAQLRREHASTAQFYLDLTELAALAGFCAFAGLALVGEPVIALLLGPAWRTAGLVLSPLCLAGAAMTLTYMQEAYLLALDRPSDFLKASLVEAILGIVFVAAAATYGPVAAGWAVALRSLCALPLRTKATLAPEKIAPGRFALVLLAPSLLAIGMYVPLRIWHAAEQGRLSDAVLVASEITLGVAIVAALLFGLMPNAVARLRTFIRFES